MLPNQDTLKTIVRIITSDPATRRLEGALNHRAPVQIEVREIPPFFRWPVVGEVWSIFYQNGRWTLGSKIPQGEQSFAIDDLNPGETLLASETMLTPSGKAVVTTDQSLAQNGLPIVWSQVANAWIPDVIQPDKLGGAKYFHYDGSTSDYALTTTPTNPNTSHFRANLQTGANPVHVRLNNGLVQGTAGDTMGVSMYIDGAETTVHRFQPDILVTSRWQPFSFEDESTFPLTAGLHVIELRFSKSNAANSMILRSGEAFGVVGSVFIVEESRPNNM